MNSNTPISPISLDTAIDKFVSELKSQKRSSATVTAYVGDLTQLKNYLNDHRLTQATTIQTSNLQDYLDHLLSNGYTAKSASRKLNSTKSFFKFLLSQGLLEKDPSVTVAHPKYDTSAPRILSSTEYKNLREVCRLDIRTSAIVELLLQTGIRISELANIRLEDIQKTEIYIRPIENNPARTIPLSKSAQIAIQNYLTQRPKDTTSTNLFITKTGRPLLVRNIRTIIDRYFRDANIKAAKVNDLRHTFAAFQLQSGISVSYLSEVLGHRRLTSTQKYLEYIKSPDTTTLTKLQEL
jgi:site-specific recombinase XerD